MSPCPPQTVQAEPPKRHNGHQTFQTAITSQSAPCHSPVPGPGRIRSCRTDDSARCVAPRASLHEGSRARAAPRSRTANTSAGDGSWEASTGTGKADTTAPLPPRPARDGTSETALGLDGPLRRVGQCRIVMPRMAAAEALTGVQSGRESTPAQLDTAPPSSEAEPTPPTDPRDIHPRLCIANNQPNSSNQLRIAPA